MQIRDAVFNWLQMKIVYEARPNDNAAKETLDFFDEILRMDHKMKHINVTINSNNQYLVKYKLEDHHEIEQQIDRELVEQLLIDIESNPKYN